MLLTLFARLTYVSVLLILYTLSLSIYLYYILIVNRNYFSNNYIIIAKGVTLVYSLHDIDIVYVIRTHLGGGTHDVVHWGNVIQWYTASFLP